LLSLPPAAEIFSPVILAITLRRFQPLFTATPPPGQYFRLLPEIVTMHEMPGQLSFSSESYFATAGAISAAITGDSH